MGEQQARRIVVGVTGASGAIIAQRLIEELQTKVDRVYVVATDMALAVAKVELGPVKDSLLRQIFEDSSWRCPRQVIRKFAADDLFAPFASGSSAPDQMVVAPCSMGSMARICHGMSSNLLERAADVVMKQHRSLVICPRESPFNTIHLKNMLELSQLGVKIVPAVPAFYHKPKSMLDLVDYIVGRLLEVMDIPHDLYRPWNSALL